MSIGNLKNNGNKGNNFPYQLNTLQILGAILDAIVAGGGGGGTGCCPAVVRTPTLLRTSAAGNVAAGARSVSIANVGNASGTVLGTTLGAGQVVSFDAGSNQDTLHVIDYSAVGTEFLISKVV